MTDDDDTLFQRLMQDAKPIRSDKRVPLKRKKPVPRARLSRAEDRAVLAESLAADIDELQYGSGEALRFQRPSVGKSTMRRLARGSYSIRAEIDLHGMTLAEAKPRLEEFLRHCAENNKHCVRIVHGKGLGSGHRGPVLKNAVNRWLRQWPFVLAFVSARQVDGGMGAAYVLLRQP